MDFCEFCNNMYYFKHDEENKITFYCKNCGAVKDLDDVDEAKQITTNNLDGTNENYTKYINPNIIYDHTIPHVNNIVCPNKECSKEDQESNNVAYIKYDNKNIKYIYCCSYCKYFWTSKF